MPASLNCVSHVSLMCLPCALVYPSGCHVDQASSIAETIASNPSSSVAFITVGVEIPLGALLGRGPAALAAVDLSQVRSRPVVKRCDQNKAKGLISH